MPSTTRGSILISTANDIGTTLVDKLGGTGYTPEEWDSAANLCGIASADIETALENITESEPQGADRGSISIAKANSIGRILNKKFDTSRGFKPSEWASAIDKLTPLEVKSASGAIASFADGADGVPVKSCVVSFLPSGGGGTPSAPVAITGVSGLSVTNHGKNYISTIEQGGIDGTSGAETVSNTRVRTGFIRVLPSTQYTCAVNSSNTNMVVFQLVEYRTGDTTGFISATGKNTASTTFTTSANTQFVRITARDTTSANITPTDLANWQLEKGNTATTYSAYTSSVVTDNFGQTIYGGTRDLVTDKATSYGYLYDLGSNNWNADANRSGVFYSNVSASGREAGSDVLGCECFDVMNINVSTSQDNYISGKPSYGGAIIFIRCTDFAGYTGAQVKTALTGLKACLKTATPTELTGLTPHENISTLLGDNNIYADTGTTTVEYRADIDLALNA